MLPVKGFYHPEYHKKQDNPRQVAVNKLIGNQHKANKYGHCQKFIGSGFNKNNKNIVKVNHHKSVKQSKGPSRDPPAITGCQPAQGAVVIYNIITPCTMFNNQII